MSKAEILSVVEGSKHYVMSKKLSSSAQIRLVAYVHAAECSLRKDLRICISSHY